MPRLKPDNTAPYIALGPQPIHSAARAKRDAEVRQNCYAILKLLAFSAIAGALLALRK